MTSVKTIKIGNPTNANIKVNVNSSVKGTSLEKSEQSDESQQSNNSDDSVAEDELEESGDPEGANRVEVYSASDRANEESNWFWATIKGIFALAWPF